MLSVFGRGPTPRSYNPDAIISMSNVYCKTMYLMPHSHATFIAWQLFNKDDAWPYASLSETAINKRGRICAIKSYDHANLSLNDDKFTASSCVLLHEQYADWSEAK